MWDFFDQNKFLSSYPYTKEPCDISAYHVYDILKRLIFVICAKMMYTYEKSPPNLNLFLTFSLYHTNNIQKGLILFPKQNKAMPVGFSDMLDPGYERKRGSKGDSKCLT